MFAKTFSSFPSGKGSLEQDTLYYPEKNNKKTREHFGSLILRILEVFANSFLSYYLFSNFPAL
jgi:hypothetical protein